MGKRLRTQRRGAGGPTYRSPSHRHKGAIKFPKGGPARGKVTELMHDPGKTAPVAVIELEDGRTVHHFAHTGESVGQEVAFGENAPVALGNTLPIGRVPEGVTIYNVEARPGDGGKFARAAGTGAVVVSHGKKTVVKLPSETFMSLDPNCMATVGMVAGGGRGDKPWAKSGKKFHGYRSRAKAYFKVSGVAMSPVDHPHGGGNHKHVGKPSTVSRHVWPGRKVGRLSPQPKKKNRRK